MNSTSLLPATARGLSWFPFTSAISTSIKASDSALGALAGALPFFPSGTHINIQFSDSPAEGNLPAYSFYSDPMYGTYASGSSSGITSGYVIQRLEFYVSGKEVPCALYKLEFVQTSVPVRPGVIPGYGILSQARHFRLQVELLLDVEVQKAEAPVFAAISGVCVAPSHQLTL
jgi:hypothetical protein